MQDTKLSFLSKLSDLVLYIMCMKIINLFNNQYALEGMRRGDMFIERHNRFGGRGVMLIIAVLVITVLVLTAIRLTQSIVANKKQPKLESRKEEE